jgi:serine/threonine-protein kinase
MEDDKSRGNTLNDHTVKKAAGRSTIPPGTMLSHTYRIERHLDGGGMADVYLAQHVALLTKHAIKVIKPTLFSDEQVLNLFCREATVLRDLREDSVVNYEGFFQDDEGRYYLVMEYVDGPSLAKMLKQRPLSMEEVYVLRDRLARGLSAAHAKGVVHRDISPDNIILPSGKIDNAKLIDFGVCKLTDPAIKTIIGDSFAGKYRFASPEQLGLFDAKVDVVSDIYSLGLVLIAAATGQPLDKGSSLESILQNRQTVPDLSTVPPELHDQLIAMLQPRPDERPQSLAELQSRWPTPIALDPNRTRIRDSYEGISKLGNQPVPKPSRRYRWPAVGLVGLALIGACIYFFLHKKDITKPLPPGSIDEIVLLPWAEVERYLQNWISLGRRNEAFKLLLAAGDHGHTLTEKVTYPFARELLDGGRKDKDKAFKLFLILGKGGHGPSSLEVGKMYDPELWHKDRSAFSKPRPRKAEEWYRRAFDQGIEEAREHLERLDGWKQQHETNTSAR